MARILLLGVLTLSAACVVEPVTLAPVQPQPPACVDVCTGQTCNVRTHATPALIGEALLLLDEGNTDLCIDFVAASSSVREADGQSHVALPYDVDRLNGCEDATISDVKAHFRSAALDVVEVLMCGRVRGRQFREAFYDANITFSGYLNDSLVCTIEHVRGNMGPEQGCVG